MLEISHISKTFNPGTANAKKAIDDLSLSVAEGDFITVIGANGAGQSSVIRSIPGLVQDTDGEVLFTPAARDGRGPRTDTLLGTSPEDIHRRGTSVSPEGRPLPHAAGCHDSPPAGQPA